MPYVLPIDATDEQVADIRARYGTGVTVHRGLPDEYADHRRCTGCGWWGTTADVGGPCPYAARRKDVPEHAIVPIEVGDGVLLPGDPDVPEDPAERAVRDALAATAALEAERQEALAALVAAVNAEAQRRIYLGFDFRGIRFSLSPTAQTNIIGMRAMLSAGAFPLPYTIIGVDDRSTTVLADEAAAGAFIGAAFVALNLPLVQSRAVRAAIAASGSLDEARAVAASWLAGGAP